MKYLVITVSVFFLTSLVLASPADQELPEPGATPGSAFFGLEQVQESISLSLTFNQERKLEKKVRYAQERLAEAQKLSKQNKSDRAEKAVRLHSNSLEKIEKQVDNLPAEMRTNVSKKLNQTRGRSLDVLKDLKENLPEKALKGINQAIKAHESKRSKNNKGNGSIHRDKRKDLGKERSFGSSGYAATGNVVRSANGANK